MGSRSWTRIRNGMPSPNDSFPHSLVTPSDRRARPEDVPLAVCDDEVTVGDPGARGVWADEDVHPVGARPQRPGLDFQQVAGVAEGVEDLLPHEGAQRFAPVALHVV